jgi:hypothetical protein
MRFRLYGLALALLAAACDQAYTADGLVVAPDSQPISQAVISLQARSSEIKATTDSSGRFSVSLVNSPLAGGATLRVAAAGFAPFVKRFAANDSAVRAMVVVLHQDSLVPRPE